MTEPAKSAANPAAKAADLVLTGVTKRFGDQLAVDALSLVIPGGSFFALLGPSGCGKTTTLRMIAGLEDPTAGSIRIGDTELTELPPYRRPVNTVFQSYALFPHLSVFENVAFGLRRRSVSDVDAQVREMLDLVELGPVAKRRPSELSGGQQQRVALARALINRPQVLLLDEPLGALDLKLRRQMQVELRRIQYDVGITFVHVTHDQDEAMTMADAIAVMNAGKIEQMGAPRALYEQPKTTFVSNFLGRANLIGGRVIEHDGEMLVLDVQGSKIRVPADRAPSGKRDLWVGVRPEKVVLAKAGSPAEPGRNALPGGVITDASFVGVSTEYLVKMPWGEELVVFEQNDATGPDFREDDAVEFRWAPDHTFLLDAAQDAWAGIEGDAEGGA